MPLVQTLFHLIFFFCFFLEDLGILIFFFFKYIHEQSTSNATWIFRIQRNIETWNKQTNFKLNHDVATKCGVRQSWATCFFLVHLGCLRLGMLEPWLWWNGLCLKWLGHVLGKLEPWLWSFGICLKWLEPWLWSFGRLEPYTRKACILWAFGLWCWSCVYTFDGLKWWA